MRHNKKRRNRDKHRHNPYQHQQQPTVEEKSAGKVTIDYDASWVQPRTESQKKFLQNIRNHDVTVAIGPAGTGKTFLAVYTALQMLMSGSISRIVLTRPVVEAGEKLGFLPGDLQEKINPYLRPLYDAFHILLGPDQTDALIRQQVIELAPLAYMRGRTLEDSFIILDEAQNTTPEQMEMLLTRMGLNSKVIVTGDITQIDLPKKEKSGLIVLEQIIGQTNGICFQHFTDADVVRHPVVKEIVKKYEIWKAKIETTKNEKK